MGLPMGKKLVKSGSTWARLCGTHISETPGWICTIRSSMELSRPVVVQHHGHYTPRTTKLLGGYTGFTPSVRPSVRLSVRPSIRPACRVRSVSSTVMDGFFSYKAQMITTIRGCVVHHDLWPWPISSRSFGLDLENRVRSVASTVLDGFFLYLAQMITIIRRCVAC